MIDCSGMEGGSETLIVDVIVDTIVDKTKNFNVGVCTLIVDKNFNVWVAMLNVDRLLGNDRGSEKLIVDVIVDTIVDKSKKFSTQGIPLNRKILMWGYVLLL